MIISVLTVKQASSLWSRDIAGRSPRMTEPRCNSFIRMHVADELNDIGQLRECWATIS